MQTTSTLITEIADILAADGWTRKWARFADTLCDPYGNVVHMDQDDETVEIGFEYALGGVVETMNLNPGSGWHGVHRIARIITALASPEE